MRVVCQDPLSVAFDEDESRYVDAFHGFLDRGFSITQAVNKVRDALTEEELAASDPEFWRYLET